MVDINLPGTVPGLTAKSAAVAAIQTTQQTLQQTTANDMQFLGALSAIQRDNESAIQQMQQAQQEVGELNKMSPVVRNLLAVFDSKYSGAEQVQKYAMAKSTLEASQLRAQHAQNAHAIMDGIAKAKAANALQVADQAIALENLDMAKKRFVVDIQRSELALQADRRAATQASIEAMSVDDINAALMSGEATQHPRGLLEQEMLRRRSAQLAITQSSQAVEAGNIELGKQLAVRAMDSMSVSELSALRQSAKTGVVKIGAMDVPVGDVDKHMAVVLERSQRANAVGAAEDVAAVQIPLLTRAMEDTSGIASRVFGGVLPPQVAQQQQMAMSTAQAYAQRGDLLNAQAVLQAAHANTQAVVDAQIKLQPAAKQPGLAEFANTGRMSVENAQPFAAPLFGSPLSMTTSQIYGKAWADAQPVVIARLREAAQRGQIPFDQATGQIDWNGFATSGDPRILTDVLANTPGLGMSAAEAATPETLRSVLQDFAATDKKYEPLKSLFTETGAWNASVLNSDGRINYLAVRAQVEKAISPQEMANLQRYVSMTSGYYGTAALRTDNISEAALNALIFNGNIGPWLQQTLNDALFAPVGGN